MDSLQETMCAEERLEYAIQVTASIWEPQVHYVVSDNVKFDSFGMAPWDAVGMFGDSCRRHETLQTMWLMQLLCRRAIMNGLNRTMRMNMENGLGRSLMTNTFYPRLAVTPGEWYASETIWMIITDLRQASGFAKIMGAMCDHKTVEFFPQLDSAASDCSAVELDDLIFRRTSFPPYGCSTGRDWTYTEKYSMMWGFPRFDSATRG